VSEPPEVRAETVELRCGKCEEITEVGTLEGECDEKFVLCSKCAQHYYVRLEVSG
jgi:hypothetical protein